MPNKIDITHTVALKNRPHPDARLIRNLDTGEAVWEGVPEPEQEKVDLLGLREEELDEAFKPLGAKVDAEVLMSEPTKPKSHHKKLHHG